MRIFIRESFLISGVIMTFNSAIKYLLNEKLYKKEIYFGGYRLVEIIP
ncbi:hypothetical protein [Tissierella pigra]|nr:hypothetical protein [Tissierella pigra]